MTLLDRIKSDEFIYSTGFALPPKAMRSALLRLRECSAFRDLYWNGAVTESMLRKYIQALMSDLNIGKRFPFDMTLALIAVALEPFSDTFADEYLYDLSRLELMELPVSIGLARVCLAERTRRADNVCRQFTLPALNTFQEISHEPENADSMYLTIEAA